MHFTHLNIDCRDRFFLVSLPAADGLDEAHGLVQHVIGRWSSHRINSKPAKERYAPFFFFPELSAQTLAQLKGRLMADGHMITDGYAYNGAPFSTAHLLLPQTREWPISARFVSDGEQFDAALAEAKRARLVIQLHAGDPRDVNPTIQQIAIPINSAGMAKKIV